MGDEATIYQDGLVHVREKFWGPSGPQSIEDGKHINDFLEDRSGDGIQKAEASREHSEDAQRHST